MTHATAEAIEATLDERFDASDFAGRSVAVAVPDLTRPLDHARVWPPLLSRLERADCDVTVVVALGLHRPLTDAELSPIERAASAHGARLIQHDARADDLVECAADVAGDRPTWPRLPARFHPAIAEADRVICVGVVEPHQYAGFSGGAKTVAIGCAAEETIGAMHGLEFLRDDRTALGNVDDNPFQRAIWRLSRPLPPIWGLMCVPQGTAHEAMSDAQGTVHGRSMSDAQGAVHAAMYDAQGTVQSRLYACYGPIEEAFEACVEVASRAYFTEVDAAFDWLHLPVEGPKAVNFYQASRAATYAALVDRPAIRRGGLIVVEAECPEGVGAGAGERACAEAMRRGQRALFAELDSDAEVATRGGQQRAYVLARALERCDIALVGAEPIDELAAMGIGQFSSLDEALRAHTPGDRGRTIGDVFSQIPRVRPSSRTID
ncbi:MAG: lactate racemase domain-containing protein [Persicimonas sp.]